MKLSDEARKAKNAKAAEWRRKNPELVKAAQARYWERLAERMKAGQEELDEKEDNKQ